MEQRVVQVKPKKKVNSRCDGLWTNATEQCGDENLLSSSVQKLINKAVNEWMIFEVKGDIELIEVSGQ